VKEIASRYTVIRGGDGIESIVPNEKLITEVVNHHTYSDTRVTVVLGVAVSFDANVDRACELLEELARRQPRVMPDPPPAASARTSIAIAAAARCAASARTRPSRSTTRRSTASADTCPSAPRSSRAARRAPAPAISAC